MTFLQEHAAGRHQPEIVQILEKMDKCFHGHSRAICLIALIRMMAVMIAPSGRINRDEYLRMIPETIQNILNEMDRIKGNLDEQ